jgi:hypothetical protein
MGGDADLERDLLSPPGKWPFGLYDCCNSDNKDVRLLSKLSVIFPLFPRFFAIGTTIFSNVLSDCVDMVFFFALF